LTIRNNSLDNRQINRRRFILIIHYYSRALCGASFFSPPGRIQPLSEAESPSLVPEKGDPFVPGPKQGLADYQIARLARRKFEGAERFQMEAEGLIDGAGVAWSVWSLFWGNAEGCAREVAGRIGVKVRRRPDVYACCCRVSGMPRITINMLDSRLTTLSPLRPAPRAPATRRTPIPVLRPISECERLAPLCARFMPLSITNGGKRGRVAYEQ